MPVHPAIAAFDAVLRWADLHHVRHGTWPKRSSGPIPEAPGETWATVCEAIQNGWRGLPDRSSLARLLAEERGVRNIGSLPSLYIERILAWADAHHARAGDWPKHKSGPILEAPGEKWIGVENALRLGLRGLPGGSSLYRLLAQERRACRESPRREGNG